MLDSIINSKNDSVSFYLKREVMPAMTDTVVTGFQSYEYLKTDSSHVYFDTTTSLFSNSTTSFADRFAGTISTYPASLLSILFLMFLFCLVLLAIWSYHNGNMFRYNLRILLSSDKLGRTVYKEAITASSIWGKIIMVFQTIVIISIFFFYFFWDKGISGLVFEMKIFSFMGILSLVFLLIFAKYLLYYIIQYVFSDLGLKEWIEKYFTLIEMVGICIFLPVIVYVFLPSCKLFAVWVIGAIFGIMILITFRSLLIIFEKNKIGLLNYFLYLCAIEIVPLFLLYKGAYFLFNMAGN